MAGGSPLAELALAAIVSLLGARAPAEGTQEHLRLADFGADVASSCAASAAPFSGSAAREAAIYATLAIAHHESGGFRAAVVDCTVRGSLGEVTAFQLLGAQARGVGPDGAPRSIEDVCGSVPLATSAALGVLERFAGACPRSGVVGWMRGYASGRCSRPPAVVAKDGKRRRVDPGLVRCRTWERLAASAGLVGASCDLRGVVDYPWSEDAP